MRPRPAFAGFFLPSVASRERGFFLPTMQKFSLELPKVRLELHYRLVKRRKPLVNEPIIPSVKAVKRKYRSGTLIGRFVRYISGHKSAKRIFAANLSAVVIAGTLLPIGQSSVQAADFNAEPSDAVIQAQNTLVTEKSIQYPLENIKVNQGFSFSHPGVDLGAEIGTPVEPVKAGVVTEAGYETDGYGNTIVIDHGNGLDSRYAHLSEIEVRVGERVTTNMEIGKVGITGHSTGPHLHLEIRQNGFPLNPLTVLPR
jgi:murein DD-endopeptidase MepM/ murein hydrolase activator NlpD